MFIDTSYLFASITYKYTFESTTTLYIWKYSIDMNNFKIHTSCYGYTECCGGTLSCSYTVGGETCICSHVTLLSTKDGQRRSGGGTTTVFVGVGIGCDGCYGTTDISLPLYTSYSEIR